MQWRVRGDVQLATQRTISLATPPVRSQLGGTKPLPRPEMQTWGVKDALQPTLASSVGLNVRRTSVVGRCSAARIVVLEMMDEPCKSTARHASTQGSKQITSKNTTRLANERQQYSPELHSTAGNSNRVA